MCCIPRVLRLEETRKARYERAAGLKGQTLTQWSLQHLDDAASRDIENARTLWLDNESFDTFCDMLEQPMPDSARKPIEQEPVWA